MRSTGGFRKSDEAEPKLRLIGCCGLGLVDVIVEGVPLRGSRVTQHVDVGSDGVAPHSGGSLSVLAPRTRGVARGDCAQVWTDADEIAVDLGDQSPLCRGARVDL